MNLKLIQYQKSWHEFNARRVFHYVKLIKIRSYRYIFCKRDKSFCDNIAYHDLIWQVTFKLIFFIFIIAIQSRFDIFYVTVLHIELGQCYMIIFYLPPMTGSGVLVKTGDIGDICSFAYAFPPKCMPFPLLLFPFSFLSVVWNVPLSPYLRL